MTNQKVAQLWRVQSRTWQHWLMLGLLLIGLITAVQTTQQHQAAVTATPAERLQQAKDYQQHPADFTIRGQRVSLAAYRVSMNQFFSRHQFTSTRDQPTLDQDPSIWYAGLMLIAGLIMAFWGRRTHYYEFLLSLGTTRWQIWQAQLRQALALLATVTIAQIIHWGWIVTVIPAKYQQYRVFSALVGTSIALVGISGCLLALGWLMGQLSQHLWLAGVISLLVWRAVNGMLSDSGYTLLITGNPNLMPGPWLYVHYYVASLLALVGFVSLVGLVGMVFNHWSSVTTSVTSTSWLNLSLLGLFGTLGIGCIVGDLVFLPFMNSSNASYEVLGMLVTLLVLSIGYWGWQRQVKGDTMARKQLRRLLWQQHWPVLVAIFIICLGLGTFQGLTGTQQWLEMRQPEFIDMQLDALRYQPATHDYVERYTHRHYASKAAYVEQFKEQHLQVYRPKATKNTATTRGKFGSGINTYYPLVAILAGVLMIWLTRHRFLNEFLQGLGATRPQLYQQQSALYIGALSFGMLAGQVANLAIIASRIPSHYLRYFSWTNWLGDFTGDVFVAVALLGLASVLNLVITNGVIVLIMALGAYLGWWLPIAFFQGGDANLVPNYLSRHWLLGVSLALALIVGLMIIGSWLSRHYSNEQRQQFVTVTWLRGPLLIVLSVPVGVLCSQLFSRLLIDHMGWLSLGLGWSMAVVILIAWIYRPKWSRKLWQLVGQLR